MLGLAMLPALGNFAAGLLAEFLPARKQVLSKTLHAATGIIIIAVASTELMPEAMAVHS